MESTSIPCVTLAKYKHVAIAILFSYTVKSESVNDSGTCTTTHIRTYIADTPTRGVMIHNLGVSIYCHFCIMIQ